MSSLSPVVQAVRDAGEKLTGSSNLTREEFLRCVRDLDTALRSPGDDGGDACAEFCAGPPDAPHRAALAWFAGKLRKGVADGGDPMRMREDVFTNAAALQVLVSASGGDHRATFGHTSRDGSHERWPVRGYALCAQPWRPGGDHLSSMVTSWKAGRGLSKTLALQIAAWSSSKALARSMRRA